MAVPNMIVTIAANATKLVSGLRTASSSIEKFGRFAGNILKTFAASAAVAFVKFSVDAVKSASDLEQAIGGTEAVFGAFSRKMQQNSEKAAKSLGLSMESYQRLGTLTGTLLKGAGVPMDKLVGKTDTLLTLAADLAATFGGTVEEAATAMNAALRGEFEPIRKFGIALSQAAIQQEALRLSGKKRITELTSGEKIQAAQNLLLQQGADASGQFARESDTLANKQQVLNAQWDNLTAILGEKLLPVVGEVVGELSDYFSSSAGKRDLQDAAQAFKDMATAMKEFWNWTKEAKKVMDDISIVVYNIVKWLDGANWAKLIQGQPIPTSPFRPPNSGNPSAPGGAPSGARGLTVNVTGITPSATIGATVIDAVKTAQRLGVR